MRHALAGASPAVAVQQAIASCDIDSPAWCVFEPLDAAGVQRGDDEAEAGNSYGKGIEVHPGNSIKSALGQHTRVGARLALGPEVEQAAKGTQQENARSRRRGRSGARAPGRTRPGPGSGVVQDEFLDKHRGLQQGVLLACLLRQVLVQVAEKTRIPCPDSEGAL